MTTAQHSPISLAWLGELKRKLCHHVTPQAYTVAVTLCPIIPLTSDVHRQEMSHNARYR